MVCVFGTGRKGRAKAREVRTSSEKVTNIFGVLPLEVRCAVGEIAGKSM